MKNIKVLLVAIHLMAMFSIVWAVNPGLEPGGGSANAQPQPAMAPEQGQAGPAIEEMAAPVNHSEAAATLQPQVVAEGSTAPETAVAAKPAAATKAPASKREMRQELKSVLKAQRQQGVAARGPQDTMGEDQVVCAIVAIFLPWLGVLLYMGGITKEFWISLILWILGILPGIIYALYVILIA